MSVATHLRVGRQLIPLPNGTAILGSSASPDLAAATSPTNTSPPGSIRYRLPKAPVRPRAQTFVAATLALGVTTAALGQQANPNFSFTDGPVHCMAMLGDTLYIGGQFRYVGPYTGGGVPLDSSTATPVPGFPRVRGNVFAAAPDGLGGWFIGGSFDSVGGVARQNLAHVLRDMRVSSWNPHLTGVVHALVTDQFLTVYVGGDFTSIDGQIASNFALLDITTGSLKNLSSVGSDGPIYALALVGGYDGRLYAGGLFSSIGGHTGLNNVAALDGRSGGATFFWNASGTDGPVYALAGSESTVYAGGRFRTVNGQVHPNLAALDANSGALGPWDPHANGLVRALRLQGGKLYAGGAFDSIGGRRRLGISAVDPTTGLAAPWDSTLYGDVYAVEVQGGTVYAAGTFTAAGEESRVVAFNAATGALTRGVAASERVAALAVSGNTLYAGGSFNSLGGQSRNNLAALDATTGRVTPWDPDVNPGLYDQGDVRALAVAGNTVYVGGRFSSIGRPAQPRSNLASLDAKSGVATSILLGADGPINALAISANTLYVGGEFTVIQGVDRSHIAALDATTGLTTGWDPGGDGSVLSLALGPRTIYAGGEFQTVGGQARAGIAAIDSSSGAPTAWDPSASDGSLYGSVLTLVPGDGQIYVGGVFRSIGGETRLHIAALDTESGRATGWNPGADGNVDALLFNGTSVFAGGRFSSIGNELRSNFAALDTATGKAQPWEAGTDGEVTSLLATSGALYIGGNFAAVHGQPIHNLAMIPLTPRIALPQPSIAVPLVTVGSTVAFSIIVANEGTTSLEVTRFDLPDSSMSTQEELPVSIPPGSRVSVGIAYSPMKPDSDQGVVRVTSNDPATAVTSIPISYRALGLNVETRALNDSVGLNQAAVIQVFPDPGVHVEIGFLHFRSAGDTAFQTVPLSPAGGAFIGVIPAASVMEGGVDYFVELKNGEATATDPPDTSRGVFHLVVANPTSFTVVPRPTSESVIAGRSIGLDVILPSGSIYVPGSGLLHYRQGGETAYATDSLGHGGPSQPLFGTIPDSVVTPRGLDYWVELRTVSGRLTFPPNEPNSTPATIRVTVGKLAEPTTHPGRRYRLLSVPLDFGEQAPNLYALLSDELGTRDSTRWRAFRYLPERRTSVELLPNDNTGAFSVLPGRAFWLITRDDHRVDTAPVSGLSTPTRAYPIVIEPGWNQIANPFAFPVTWDSVRKPDSLGTLAAFEPRTGDYTDTTILEPFEGYFLEDTVGHPQTLWVRPIKASTSEPASGAARLSPDRSSPLKRMEAGITSSGSGSRTLAIAGGSDHSWRIRLKASTPGSEDGSNVLGVDPAATDGIDSLDATKPPTTPGGGVEIGFAVRGATTHRLMRRDLRAPGADGHSWEVEARGASAGEPITIQPISVVAPPHDLQLRLVDRELGGAVDLLTPDGSPATYRLISSGLERAYRLTVFAATADYVARAVHDELGAPDRLVLHHVSPNPFYVFTRIRFGLPEAEPVTLEIYDVLGRRVARLLDCARLPAGYHVAVWDGTNGNSAPVPDGMYFCRIMSPEGTLSHRMAKVK